MSRFPWQLAIAVLAVTGCTSVCGVKRSGMSPEAVVEAYLDTALNMQDVGGRDALLDYVTGPLKAAIESAPPATIKAAYVDRRYSILNYSVVERRDRTPRETEITFQLTYNEIGTAAKNAKDAPKVTTENTVAVVKERGLWLIRDVMGAKTSIDFPVAEEARITAKAGPGIDSPEDMYDPGSDASENKPEAEDSDQ